MRQKGFAPLIIVIILALIGIVGAYYLGGLGKLTVKNDEQPTTQPIITEKPSISSPKSTSIPDETANWKTYIETREVKFTIKYPSTWIVDTKDSMWGGKGAIFDSDKEAIGSVAISWNSQPVEPNCNTGTERKESIQIKNHTIEMCHSLGSTQEPESYSYNGSLNGVNYSIVTGNYPGDDKRKMILKVLSTLQI